MDKYHETGTKLKSEVMGGKKTKVESPFTKEQQIIIAKSKRTGDPHRFCRAGGGNNFHCGCKYDS
jgi:hypothetical protein